ELIQKVEIEIGKIVDCGEPARLFRTAKAGMARCKHPSPRRQQIEDGSFRVDADVGMKKEERAAMTSIDDLKRDAVNLDRACGGRQGCPSTFFNDLICGHCYRK